MSNAKSSAGAKILWGNGATPEIFTQIGEVVSFGGFNPSAEKIDVTHLTSPGRRREFVQSFIDGGSIPVSANFLAEHISDVIDEFTDGTVRNWRLYFPIDTPKNVTFPAHVESYEVGAAVGEKVTFNFTISVDGLETWSTA